MQPIMDFYNRLSPNFLQLINRLLKFFSRKRQLIILPLIILVFTVTSCRVHKNKSHYAEVVNVEQYVSLREQPNARSQVKCTIAKGELVVIIVYQKDGWAHVKYKEQDGYVKSQYLRYVGHKNDQALEPDQSSLKPLLLKLFHDATNTWWSKVLWILMLISPLLVRFIFGESIAEEWFKIWLLVILLIPGTFIAMIWIKLAVDIQHFFLWLGQLPLSVPWGPVIADTHNKIIMFVYTFITAGALYILIVSAPLLIHRILYEWGEGNVFLNIVYAVYLSAIIIGTLDPHYTDSMPSMIADLCRYFQTEWDIHLSEYSTRSDYEVLDVVTIVLNIIMVIRFND